MLWPLIKILVFVAVVAAAAVGASALMDMEGGIQISAMGFELTLGALETVIALCLLVIAVWVGLKLLGLLIATLRFITATKQRSAAISTAPASGAALMH